ncbi:signal peptidase I [Thermovenabulum sp.]|uniref:signal peptidase I n=1 Tax=Thermovenabulum sp. TaxID=3100335 RepID=UPI003C7BCEE3
MKIILKVINILITTALVILIVFSSLLIYQTRTENTKMAFVLGYKPLTVLSGSMAPLLMPGDVVVIKKVNPNDIKKGDIITFITNDNVLITHRVTEIIDKDGKRLFETKGDANNVEDSKLVTSDNIIGVMKIKIPYAGYIGRYAKTPIGYLVMILIPGLLLLAGEVTNVYNTLIKQSNIQK